MYINISRVVKDMRTHHGGTSYTYTVVSNLLSGFKGNATKKDIQALRKLIKEELTRIDKNLQKLENE